MKKLLVFLSIFAILFVSTIRPLQAEQLTDNFVLVNGRTYYLIIDENIIEDNLLISAVEGISYSSDITLRYEGNFDTIYLSVRYSVSGSSQYFDIPLIYEGIVEEYSTSYSVLYNALVFSFVWTPFTISNYSYDDVNFVLDSENPIPPVSIYDTIYSLVNKYVFGNNIESGSHQDLIATLLSSIAVVFVFALPFLLVWKVLKLIMG